ncbi:nucleotidyltransferase family protein [uncultured Rhodoblastus sp.]|uniref:nucleotidyltransferase family protein n=1 Tax=uncultured Rhodoblastus sp. TaxID=543037 RepID=UPI0025CD6FA5|nr:nucleotidyltransferase family protein [uncultured Rhodoblastus sp.]
MSARPEKALVFAAGLGTRMRPITLTVPKPLVRVGGRAMLDHMLDRLDEAGIAEAIVNVHWLADQIEDHLRDRTAPRIKISDERETLLDQGGGIVKVLDEFHGRPFFICNTDALWIEEPRSQLARLACAWDGDKMDVLLLLAETGTSVGVDWRGDFFADAQGRLRRPGPGETAPFVYSGVGIIKSSLFVDCPLAPFRLAPFFFAAAEQGRLFGLPLEGRWLHVGDPEAIGEAERIYASAVAV